MFAIPDKGKLWLERMGTYSATCGFEIVYWLGHATCSRHRLGSLASLKPGWTNTSILYSPLRSEEESSKRLNLATSSVSIEPTASSFMSIFCMEIGQSFHQASGPAFFSTITLNIVLFVLPGSP